MKIVSRAWWATVTLFLLHGLIVATWVSRIPAIQIALKMSNGILGATLLCVALGALVTIPFTGALINRYGSKRVSSLSSGAFCLALVLPALASNAIVLGAALFVFGGAASAMDVSMNAQGVEIEKRLGRPTMSRFHGMFSLGAMVGAESAVSWRRMESLRCRTSPEARWFISSPPSWSRRFCLALTRRLCPVNTGFL